MGKKIIAADNAPAAVGPYSQAVRVGDFIFLSGQIPLDPKTGQIVGDNVTAQTVRVMENLKAVLAEANLTFDHVVKTTVYLSDMSFFQAMNEVYGAYFSKSKPARATVQAARLPKDALVEIDAIAYAGK